MPVYTFSPSRVNFAEIIVPAVSAQRVTASITTGLTAAIKSVSASDPMFIINPESAINTVLRSGVVAASSVTFTVSSNWSDTFFDGSKFGTFSIYASGNSAATNQLALSTDTYAISALFSGYDYPSEGDPAQSSQDTERIRLYMNGEI